MEIYSPGVMFPGWNEKHFLIAIVYASTYIEE